jgi:plasmid stabilization system protein ParE
MKLLFTPIARDDLEAIWEYIAEENPSAATRVAQMLMQKCRTLVANPRIGRLAPGGAARGNISYTLNTTSRALLCSNSPLKNPLSLLSPS